MLSPIEGSGPCPRIAAASDETGPGSVASVAVETGTVDPKVAAAKFEAVLGGMLLSEMRKASGIQLFGDGAGAQVFEGMFDQMLGEAITAGRGFGLARDVEASIRRMSGPTP
ncbi:MAG TPA: rod-binding protein [Planctomycetota bacterium]|nr:rod-binding protein [Planctomycetota bacterium]